MPSSCAVGDHYETFVRDLVSTGRYSSASEVLRDGLRLLEEREQLREIKLKALREAIQEGLDSRSYEPWDVEEIKAEGRRILAERRRA
jgi:antitoxin ParD1/3/4